MEADIRAKVIFWSSAGFLAWAHLGYPAALTYLARIRPRPVRKRDIEPTVTVIIPAHDEEAVIGCRLENLRALDYPPDRLEILVASDCSSDRTDEIVAEVSRQDARISLLRYPRLGKLRALNAAVREASGEVVAFTDANTIWSPDALRQLVRSFDDPHVGYVCGKLELRRSGGTNRDSIYWRYELWLRAKESAIGSITGGNGAIYAVPRARYPELRVEHDLGLPQDAVRRGMRAVFEPDAAAIEQEARDLRDEYRRKVRMIRGSWQQVLEGGAWRGGDPLYLWELASHRLLRYCLPFVHLCMLASNVALARRARPYAAALVPQLGVLAAAASSPLRTSLPGSRIAAFYVLMNVATVHALVDYLRAGAPATWEPAAGTR